MSRIGAAEHPPRHGAPRLRASPRGTNPCGDVPAGAVPGAGPLRRAALAAALALSGAGILSSAAGCNREDMHNQPRHEPYEKSVFFQDGQSNRPLVEGTVAHGNLEPPELRYSGPIDPNLETVDTYPIPVTRATLERGAQRYNIYCAVCHGYTGEADGMIVQRGFTKPPSFLEPRLRQAAAGHYYNAITAGWGAMYSYADRVAPEDRWAITAYIRVLQMAKPEGAGGPGDAVLPTSAQPGTSGEGQGQGQQQGQEQGQGRGPGNSPAGGSGTGDSAGNGAGRPGQNGAGQPQ